MKVRIFLYLLFLAMSIVVGCKGPEQIEEARFAKPAYDSPLPPGQYALRKITNPADIPDFTFGMYEFGRVKAGGRKESELSRQAVE